MADAVRQSRYTTAETDAAVDKVAELAEQVEYLTAQLEKLLSAAEEPDNGSGEAVT